jgi:hypothetical protein
VKGPPKRKTVAEPLEQRTDPGTSNGAPTTETTPMKRNIKTKATSTERTGKGEHWPTGCEAVPMPAIPRTLFKLKNVFGGVIAGLHPMKRNMTTREYNGWTNYETWAVALWLDNEQATHEYWCAQAKRHREESPRSRQVADRIWTIEEATKYNLADQLKEEVENNVPEVNGVYSDLLTAALDEVDWHAIAEHYLQKVAECYRMKPNRLTNVF